VRDSAAFLLATGLIFSGLAVRAEVLTAGEDDGFAGAPEPAVPGPELARALSIYQGTQDFDLIPNVGEGRANRQIAHTFTGLPETIVSATLELRARAGQASGTSSDGVFLSFLSPEDETFVGAIEWRRSFGPMSAAPPVYLEDDPGLVPSWHSGDEATLAFDLSALPLPDGTTLDLLPEIAANGFLDVTVSDDTGADFYRLSIVSTTVGVDPQDFAAIDRLTATPNPFRDATAIEFELPSRGEATIRIFEVSGRLVRTYRTGGATAGARSVVWDGRDDSGADAGSGVFFYRLDHAGRSRTKRLVRLR
jgi:hypothetical protein